MNILICNDDGIFSEGLLTLANFLSKKHKVVVVAPKDNCSGYSHSMSFFKKLGLKEEKISNNFKSYSLTGTPADCVKFGVEYFKEQYKFDIVCAGINIGNNLGTDTLYSGTVSSCVEASILGVKNIAFSVNAFDNIDFKSLQEHTEKIFNIMVPYLSADYVWNINIPNLKEIKGIKITKLGVQKYSDRYENLGNNEYMLVGEALEHDKNDLDCDVEWIQQGYATATPMIIDKTAYSLMNSLPKEIDL